MWYRKKQQKIRKMGDETDHQSVRQLTEDVNAGDHAQSGTSVMSSSEAVNKGGSPSAKGWVKFEEDGTSLKDETKTSPEKSNANSKVRLEFVIYSQLSATKIQKLSYLKILFLYFVDSLPVH